MIQIYNFEAKDIPQKKQIELIKLYRKTNDNKYKEEVILANVKLIYKFIEEYCQDDTYKDDCLSIGFMALNKAIDKFDIDNKYNATFTTYVSKAIKNGIWRYLNKEAKAQAYMSLEEPINYSDYGDPIYLKDVLPDTTLEDEFDDLTYDTVIKFMDKYFSERTMVIFYYKFGLYNYPKLKEKEIAEILNMSRGNVAMAYAKGLRAIKSYINNKRTPKRRI